MKLSHSPVFIHFRRLAATALICAAFCAPQTARLGAEEISHQIARVVKELQLEPAEKLTYTRRGYTSDDGSPSRYLLQLESDGSVSVYYSGGRNKNKERAYSQTYYHGKWDESRNSPAEDQRERWNAYHPPMSEKEDAAQPSRADKLNPGVVGPSNLAVSSAVAHESQTVLRPEDTENPLGVFSTILNRRAKIAFKPENAEKHSLLARVQSTLSSGGRVYRVELQLDDGTSYPIEVRRDSMELATDVLFGGRYGSLLSVSTMRSDVVPPAPPAVTQFAVEKWKSSRGETTRWAIRYGESTSVRDKTPASKLLIIDPPEAAQGISDYRVEVLDSADHPYFKDEDFPQFVIRVAVHVPAHQNAVGKRIEAGVKYGKANGLCTDGKEYTGEFILNEAGLVTGGDVYRKTPEPDIRVDQKTEPRRAVELGIATKDRTQPESRPLNPAEQLLRQGRFDDAIKGFSMMISADGDVTVALRRRAFCFEAVRDLQLAIEDYSQLIRKDPADLEALVLRAMCRMDLEQYSLAVADLDAAARLSPNRALICLAHGLCHQKLQGGDAGLPEITQAMTRNPYAHLLLLNRVAVRDAFADTGRSQHFLKEYSGTNDVHQAWTKWNSYRFNFEMAQLYESYNSSGRRVYDDPNSAPGLKRAYESHIDSINTLKRSRRLPTEAEHQLLRRKDADSFQGTWLVTAIHNKGQRLTSPASPQANVVWIGDRMEVVIGGQPMLTVRDSQMRRETAVAGQVGEQIRWWGEFNGTLTDTPFPLRGWYLYEPASENDDVELLAVKLGSIADMMPLQLDSRPARHAVPAKWDMEVFMMRNDRIRRFDREVSSGQIAAEAQKRKGALEKLQGQWILISQNGRSVPDPVHFAFESDRLVKTMYLETGTDPQTRIPANAEWSLEFDHTTSPPKIDWVYPRTGRRRLGIYSLIDGTLTLAHSPFEATNRPETFDETAAQGREVIILRRPDEKAAPVQANP